jgi:hypothetical protein
MLPHIPSLYALESKDEGPLSEAVRLGYRLLEAAAPIAAAPRSEASGVFAMPRG